MLLAPHRTLENADDPCVTLTLRVRRSTRDELAYAQSLASHALASADLGVYVERAADVLVAHEEKRRFGAGSRSGPRTCGTDERDARAGAGRDAHPGAGRRCCGMSARGRARAS